MDMAITFSLTTTSCQHKVNKSCTSVVCWYNKGCCDGCYYHIFIDHYFLSAQGTAGAAVSFSGKSQFTDFCAQTCQIKVRFLLKSQFSKANIVNNAKNSRYIVQLEVVSIQGFIVYFWP